MLFPFKLHNNIRTILRTPNRRRLRRAQMLKTHSSRFYCHLQLLNRYSCPMDLEARTQRQFAMHCIRLGFPEAYIV
jgi:hypothetical protein